MTIAKFRFYKDKKQVLSLLLLVGVSIFIFTPISESTGGFLYMLLQGTKANYKGYDIYLGLTYVYSEADQFGGPTLQKVGSRFIGLENDYFLSFDEGSRQEVDATKNSCSDVNTTCEEREFNNYLGISAATFIRSNNMTLTKTVYYKPNCEIHISHRGKAFDERYNEVVEKFFSENCL